MSEKDGLPKFAPLVRTIDDIKIEEFEAWCVVRAIKTQTHLNLRDFVKDARPLSSHEHPHTHLNAFVHQIRRLSKTKDDLNVKVDSYEKVQVFSFPTSDDDDLGKIHVDRISVGVNEKRRAGLQDNVLYRKSSEANSPDYEVYHFPNRHNDINILSVSDFRHVFLRGVSIRDLAISGKGTVCDFDRCFLERLTLSGAVRADIRNCMIGTLVLTPNCIENLRVSGGTIRNIECPMAGADNPFSGPVLFSNVDFPKPWESLILQDAQPYRNLRAHLEDLQNIPAANKMRALELRSELHDDDSWTLRLVNLLYGEFVEHGTSPARALFWFLGTASITAVILLIFGGSMPGEGSVGKPDWRSVFARDGDFNELARCVYLAFRPFFNPFGILFQRDLVAAAAPWAQAVLWVQGIFGYVFLFLAGFAIRRRFKIS